MKCSKCGYESKEPGTTFTEKEIQRFCVVLFDRNVALREMREVFKIIADDEKQDGLTAVTNKKKK